MGGSPPFNLSSGDWWRIIIGAILSMLGGLSAYLTGSAIPELQAHAQNDWGLLIVSVMATVVPILGNIILKFITDTTPKPQPNPPGTTQPTKTVIKGLLIFAVLTLGCAAPGFAADALINVSYGSAENPGFGVAINWATLFQDPIMLIIIVAAAMLFTSKFLNIDLRGILLPILKSLADGLMAPRNPAPPASPAPTTTAPTTTNPAPATPNIQPTDLLALLLQLLNKAGADPEQKAAVYKVMDLMAKPAT